MMKKQIAAFIQVIVFAELVDPQRIESNVAATSAYVPVTPHEAPRHDVIRYATGRSTEGSSRSRPSSCFLLGMVSEYISKEHEKLLRAKLGSASLLDRLAVRMTSSPGCSQDIRGGGSEKQRAGQPLCRLRGG